MSQVRLTALAKGLATRVPGLRALACRSSGGTVSARYCYTVWLRHLVMAHQAGLPADPGSVAELGPGDSFGIGLAAMLSGADRYYALDARAHAREAHNLSVFDQLLALFEARAPLPDHAEFPAVSPRLADYAFPSAVLPEHRLARSLDPERVAAIRRSLTGQAEPGGPIRISYAAPWDDASVIEPGAVDMAYSQAVLEHVDQVAATYECLGRWIRPGGFMSHAIDYKSHGTAHGWSGHWTVSDRQWNIVRGDRPYLINRAPHSVHVAAIRAAGFRIVTDLREQSPPLPREALAGRFRTLSDDDLRTSGTFLQAVR